MEWCANAESRNAEMLKRETAWWSGGVVECGVME